MCCWFWFPGIRAVRPRSGLGKRYELSVVRHSEAPTSVDADVYLGDTMGDLPTLYAGSDVAFVGGSLVDVGGHNVLEPAALGLPVLVGPHVGILQTFQSALSLRGPLSLSSTRVILQPCLSSG